MLVKVKRKKAILKKKSPQPKRKTANAQKTAAKKKIIQKKTNMIVMENAVTAIVLPLLCPLAFHLLMILIFRIMFSISQQKKQFPITTEPTFLMVSLLFGYPLK